MKTGINVSDAMTKKPVVVSQNTSIKECARIMEEKDVSSLAIKEGTKIVGMVTEKDIVRRSIAREKNTDGPVKEIMSREIVRIGPEEDIYDALLLMNQTDIRRLPVVSKNELVGLLTDKDILKIQPSLFEIVANKIQVKEEKEKLALYGICSRCSSEGPVFISNKTILCGSCIG